MNTIGLILMGGLNTRMGGEKKALLQYKGKCFYEYVAKAVRDAGIQQVYASVEKQWQIDLGMEQIVDKYEKIGPLGGIVTALNQLDDVQGVLVLPCDLPQISSGLIKMLMERFEETGLPVVLMSEGRLNPLVAIYTKACLPVLEEQIAEGNFRAMYWTRLVEHAEVVLNAEDEYMISNINSKEDYEALTNSDCEN